MKEYDYFAFISYKHADEKWAKWLQKSLERYRLPTAVRKKNDELPKKVYPVCRDATDFSPGDLNSEIHSKLDRSRYLIVICSENLIKQNPHYIESEINHFVFLGRSDRIIPVIVSGEIGTENECFPEILKNESFEALGVDIQKDGKRNAVTRIVSKLLEIDYNILLDREKKRRQKKTSAAAVAAACAIFVGAFALNYYMPHKKYYVDYVERWGIPEGICEVSKSDTKSMFAHYTIITRKGKVAGLIRQ